MQFACYTVFEEAGQNEAARQCLTTAIRLNPREKLFAQHLAALDDVDKFDDELDAECTRLDAGSV